MKKFFFALATVVFLTLFTQISQAVTVESQSEKTSELQTFIVLASPDMNSTAVQLRLEVQGGTITSFSAGDDGLLSIGVCDEENNKFTETKVCVDIANATDVFEYGDVLGVFTVEREDNLSQLRITKTEGNSYMGPDGVFKEDSGEAFLLFGTTTEKPKSTETETSAYLYMFLLIAFLSGVVFGTTFTTLGHVLQAGKPHKTHSKRD